MSRFIAKANERAAAKARSRRKLALQSEVLAKFDDAANALEWIKGNGICDEDCGSFYDIKRDDLAIALQQLI